MVQSALELAERVETSPGAGNSEAQLQGGKNGTSRTEWRRRFRNAKVDGGFKIGETIYRTPAADTEPDLLSRVEALRLGPSAEVPKQVERGRLRLYGGLGAAAAALVVSGGVVYKFRDALSGGGKPEEGLNVPSVTAPKDPGRQPSTTTGETEKKTFKLPDGLPSLQKEGTPRVTGEVLSIDGIADVPLSRCAKIAALDGNPDHEAFVLFLPLAKADDPEKLNELEELLVNIGKQTPQQARVSVDAMLNGSNGKKKDEKCLIVRAGNQVFIEMPPLGRGLTSAGFYLYGQQKDDLQRPSCGAYYDPRFRDFIASVGSMTAKLGDVTKPQDVPYEERQILSYAVGRLAAIREDTAAGGN